MAAADETAMPSIPPPGWEDRPPSDGHGAAPETPPPSPDPEPALKPIGTPGALQERRLAASQARGRDTANTDKGLAGERRVSDELAAALASTGAILINSLRFLHWGDIDHLIIGPGGITVVDAKNWAGEITVVDGVPCVDGRKKYDKLEGLIRQKAGVQLALAAASAELRNVDVQAVMCFADDPSRPVSSLAGGVTLAGSAAAGAIGGRGGPLSTDDIRHLQTVLMAELPKIRRAQIDAFLGGGAPDTAGHEHRSSSSTRPPRVRMAPRRRAARGTPHRSGRGRHARRVERRVERDLAVLIALLLVGGAYWLLDRPATARVSHLGVLAGWPARVTFSAPPQATVELAVFRSGHATRVTTVTAAGGTETWQVPIAWTHRTRSFTVEACILDAQRRCVANTTAGASARWSGTKLLGWTPS